MRSVVYRAPETVRVVESPPPRAAGADLLIAVDACGVCGSDLASFAHGHYIDPGQVMGHEIAGRVVDMPEPRDGLAVGDRVAVRPMRSCGACGYCRTGDAHLCGETAGPSLGYGTPGGFADLVLIADARVGEDVVRVPDEVDPLDLLWAEPLAVALHALDRADVSEGRILVLGAGAVGLTVVAVARSAGLDVVAADPIASRREAASGLGAAALDPEGVPGTGPYAALFDASGVAAAVRAAVGELAPAAPIVLVGLGDADVPFPAGAHRVRGSFAYRQRDFTASVDMIASGRVRLGHLVTHRFGLADAELALAGARPGEPLIKAALVPQEGIAS